MPGTAMIVSGTCRGEAWVRRADRIRSSRVRSRTATWLRKATPGYTGTVLIGNDLQRLTLHTPTSIR